jgi:hypothetical protein
MSQSNKTTVVIKIMRAPACAVLLSVLCVSALTGPSARVAAPVTLTQTPDKPATQTAVPSDVASMDSVVAALYDVISGPAGKKRDWDRMRSLFIPGARLIPTGKRQTGEIGSRVLTVEDYINGSAKLIEENGFFEKEISRRTESYGNIAHVFSTGNASNLSSRQSRTKPT